MADQPSTQVAVNVTVTLSPGNPDALISVNGNPVNPPPVLLPAAPADASIPTPPSVDDTPVAAAPVVVAAPPAPAPAAPEPTYAWYDWHQVWRFLKACGRFLLRVMNKAGLELAEDARHFYKFVTFWWFIVLMSAPDIWNLAIQNDLFQGKPAPAKLTYIINMISFIGAASKIVQVRKAQQSSGS